MTIAFSLATLLLFALWLRRQGRFERVPVVARPRESTAFGTVETVYFDSHGTRIEAWLFEPAERTELVVVMAPGLGSTKDSLLEPFAWAFVRAGAAVLLFDFRTLGGSEGTPRHHVDPFRQIEDYEAALDFARARFARVVLWGSSFSGGEVLCLAARRPRAVDAVIAHSPFLATSAELEPKGLRLARFVLLTLLDLALARLSLGRLPPVYISAYGKPNEFVFSPSEECPSRYAADAGAAGPFWRALPEHIRGGWQNVLCARMLANIDRFVPLRELPHVECPVLLIGAQRDTLIPNHQIRTASEKLRTCELTLFDCAHFDLYVEPILAQNLEVQRNFIARMVG